MNTIHTIHHELIIGMLLTVVAPSRPNDHDLQVAPHGAAPQLALAASVRD
jgi:hypothetical protein